MIDKTEVRRVARLAHLEYPGVQERLIDEETLERLARDMDQILEYVKQLEAVDVTDVPPTSHGVDLPPVMREDTLAARTDPEKLRAGAPTLGDAVVVPKIVE